jgi:hypothetical protein
MTFIVCFFFAPTRFAVNNNGRRAPTALRREFAAFDLAEI